MTIPSCTMSKPKLFMRGTKIGTVMRRIAVPSRKQPMMTRIAMMSMRTGSADEKVVVMKAIVCCGMRV